MNNAARYKRKNTDGSDRVHASLYRLIDLGEAFRAPLQSDVPALFISGTLDGRTPPGKAKALMPGFSDAAHLLVHGASHDDELWRGDLDIAARMPISLPADW